MPEVERPGGASNLDKLVIPDHLKLNPDCPGVRNLQPDLNSMVKALVMKFVRDRAAPSVLTPPPH
jgi:hypothetical protein